MAQFKPTLKEPPSKQGEKYMSNFNKTMAQSHIKLDEVDELLNEREQSLKKKIFSLAKMEALVFGDPKLSMIYDKMAVNGEEKYGYHYNETIQNMIFNDYVLNSPKYLEKYKMAIPKKKKRRDKSGINQLKIAGEKKMAQTGLPKQSKITEGDDSLTKVVFLVNEKNPQNSDLFAYFPEENYDNQGRLKTGYSHVGQHSAVDPRYAEESRPATPEEYQDLKSELESIGYNLDVVDSINEMSGTGGGTGGGAFSGSGQYSAPLGYEKPIDETTGSASSGQYTGPAVWGGGDLMKVGGKAHVKKIPMVKGGTIIGESKINYLINPVNFEKYINSLNENVYEQINIENPSASQKPNVVPDANNKSNKKIIDKTSAFTSNTVKQWGKEDTNLQNKTINTGKMDEPNLKTVKEAYSPDMISTKEQLKQFVQNLKQTTGKGLGKQHIPMLAGEALHAIAIQLADKMLPVSWEDLADTNSMWDYINYKNGGMSYENLLKAVNRAAKKRLKNDDSGWSNIMENKINEKAVSKAQQRFFGMVRGLQKGELKPSEVGDKVEKAAKTMKEKDVEDFASTKHKKLPEKIDEDMQSMINDSPDTMAFKPAPTGTQGSNAAMGMQTTGMANESKENKMKNNKLLETLEKELKAFSIYHKNLKKMTEDRKPSALVLKDRLGNENQKNFKSDLKDSSISKIVDIENALEFSDQQTEIKNPYKLGQDIEKNAIKTGDMKSGEALKNVGNSDNDSGDEIPKRNLTDEEQEEVNNYRLGLGDLVYDNKPSKRFEDRMKADMGDKLYKQRQDKLEFRGKAPMYNKDTQPTETGIDKVQFDKEKSGWNEREGIQENYSITAKYFNILGKKKFIDFNLNEAVLITEKKPDLIELNFDGLGNSYTSKVDVNESVIQTINNYKYYTDTKNVFKIKNPVQKLNENEQKNKKPVINEQFSKMKHLLGYKPENYTKTNNVKKNRGF